MERERNIPERENDFLKWIEEFIAYAIANAIRWAIPLPPGMDPDAEFGRKAQHKNPENHPASSENQTVNVEADAKKDENSAADNNSPATVDQSHEANTPAATEMNSPQPRLTPNESVDSPFIPLLASYTDYVTKYNIAHNPKTASPSATRDKTVARKVLENEVRKFMREHIYNNPRVTEGDCVALKIPVHKKTRSSIGAPTTRPGFELTPVDVYRLAVHYHEIGTNKKAKPYGVIGLVIAFGILATAPLSPDELPHRVFVTRSPHVFSFNGEDSGKRFYAAICWQNAKGEFGPWSNIQSINIP
jgi:hypothetical protein